jgi:hypothetical protein
MALTRSFKETVQARVLADRSFREALLREAIDTMLAGDIDIGKAILSDYRGQSRRRAVPRVLQRSTPAHRARRPNAGRGILHPTNLKDRSLNEIRDTRWRPVRGYPPPQEIHLRNAEICLN